MNNPYENLANSIILQAVKDYRLHDDEKELAVIERFFRSAWFGILTNIDPEMLIANLRKERRAMNTKAYLSQARYLDMRIKSKLQQIDSLNELATTCSSVLTGMPRNPRQSNSPMADAVVKIIDLQNEVQRDIYNLIDLKKEITDVIKTVANPEHQTLLEKRYLCFLSWEKIAVDMSYDLRYIHKLHTRALDECRIPAIF